MGLFRLSRRLRKYSRRKSFERERERKKKGSKR